MVLRGGARHPAAPRRRAPRQLSPSVLSAPATPFSWVMARRWRGVGWGGALTCYPASRRPGGEPAVGTLFPPVWAVYIEAPTIAPAPLFLQTLSVQRRVHCSYVFGAQMVIII